MSTPSNQTKKCKVAPTPVFRRLRGYAFDPSLSVKLDTALVNEAVFKVRWEEGLERGPVGEYLEVVDYDPASKCFYAPVDLNHPYVLAQDGLMPSESDPQFHQQMVYSVAMTTIENFERALGRKALWSSYREGVDESNGVGKVRAFDTYHQRLRVYPHALREANAYYSPAKKALLFGYFPASGKMPNEQLPNGVVFTCLSHDIIAHETTHALLDGMHRRFIEANHPDSLAFHEAFADIVALFQHFSFPEVLRHQISKTRGDLASQNLLGELAQQFGKAIGHYGALRDAIGGYDKAEGKWKPHRPDPNEYQRVDDPHARGAILVAAIFEAFLSIYKCRVADLLRIATSGTGILQPGELHPDLVNRLANEASKTAQHILNMCIRALDYCPPVDVNFGDYLRALITADTDLVPDDDLGYRIALIESFRRRGIYPTDIRTLSEDSLCWPRRGMKGGVFTGISEFLRKFIYAMEYIEDRQVIYQNTKKHKAELNILLKRHVRRKESLNILEDFEDVTGLFFRKRMDAKVDGLRRLEKTSEPTFEVHALRGARRVGPDGDSLNQVIISITQTRNVPFDGSIKMDDLPPEEGENVPQFMFRGGCTLIFDLKDLSLRYAVVKRIDDAERLRFQRDYRTSDVGRSLRSTYFGQDEHGEMGGPFALLHRSF